MRKQKEKGIDGEKILSYVWNRNEIYTDMV